MATRVLPDAELMGTALAKAREIAQWPIDSLVGIKRIMRAMHGDKVAQANLLEIRQELPPS